MKKYIWIHICIHISNKIHTCALKCVMILCRYTSTGFGMWGRSSSRSLPYRENICWKSWAERISGGTDRTKIQLVGGIPTPLKNMSSSIGMMTFPIYGKIQVMFQTTNQYIYIYIYIYIYYHCIVVTKYYYYQQLVLLVKIALGRWLVCSTIYHQPTCCKKGLVWSPSFFINQPMGIWDI